jgi:2-amino-4-hydroxy-6-hydroxymethyldihydropteridine diphosphokinase
LRFLRKAAEAISAHVGEPVLASTVYETEPVGYVAQPWYFNAVLLLRTPLPARMVYQRLKELEGTLGRRPSVRWGPREIDLDLLLFDDLCARDNGLVLPHPRMHERAFVMVPLTEIAPGIVHPVLGRTARELLDAVRGSAAVRPVHPPAAWIRLHARPDATSAPEGRAAG